MTALHYEWAVGLPTISKIVPEVLKAIYLRLRGYHSKTPTSEREWRETAQEMANR